MPGMLAVRDQRVDVHLRVPDMAQRIASELELLPSGQALPELAVTPLGTGDALRTLRERAEFVEEELESLEAHLLSGESAYVPRARAACLASLSVHHAAEEAAHFVRHWAVGDAMDRARPWDEAFYARIWEEALGFVGSRIIAPGRPCPDLEEWSRTFREEDGERRQIAAHVLAHKAVEKEQVPQLERVRPPRRPRLFHAVTHALGYLLGDALSEAQLAGPPSLRSPAVPLPRSAPRPAGAVPGLGAPPRRPCRVRSAARARARGLSARDSAQPPSPLPWTTRKRVA